MIKTETIGNFIRTWSDQGKLIHGGMPEADYSEAYDPIDIVRTYIETEYSGEDADNDDFIAALVDLGVNFNEEE